MLTAANQDSIALSDIERDDLVASMDDGHLQQDEHDNANDAGYR